MGIHQMMGGAYWLTVSTFIFTRMLDHMVKYVDQRHAEANFKNTG